MKDISVVMVTVDRSPQPNYLSQTLSNLYRGGVFKSPRLSGFHLIDSRNNMYHSIPDQLAELICFHGAVEFRNANENVAEALEAGAFESDWVLFLEDDIDVCSLFLDGVGHWLDKHQKEDRRIYVFGSVGYWNLNRDVADIEIKHFFGTQAIALRREDARSLSEYLIDHQFDKADDGSAYDLLMHGWAKEQYPGIKMFSACYPSFVQHIGRESIIRPRPKTHQFKSWRGKDWAYVTN